MEDKRVVALEVSQAYHEDMLKELNGVIIGQQKQIDELNLTIRRLAQKIEDLVELVGDDTDPGEKPPHY